MHRDSYQLPSQRSWPLIAFALSCVIASIAPVTLRSQPREPMRPTVPSWPTHFEGRVLTPLSLGEQSLRFARDFPGVTARFTDGRYDIVMRWVTQPTRRLHPAADCYRGLGYALENARVMRDGNQAPWHCFIAKRRSDSRDVCEQIQDTDGRHWSDVSAWYWDAVLNRSAGPWLVVTTQSRIAD